MTGSTPSAAVALFEGMDDGVVSELLETLPLRRFAPGQHLCRTGDPGRSMFILRRGLADIVIDHTGTVVERLRRGDVVGEMSMLTGEPRTASVVARVATDALELDRDTFTAAMGNHPELLTNLTRILSIRLARTTRSRVDERRRGEAISLVVRDGLDPFADRVIEAAQRAAPGQVAVIELRGDVAAPDAVANALGALDDELADNSTVVIAVPARFDEIDLLTMQTDRTVLLSRTNGLPAVAGNLSACASVLEVVEVVEGGPPSAHPHEVGSATVLRSVTDEPRHVRWLGRHLTRTKLGVALGAGGAKGYAHVGALRVLEDAGYEVDAAAGSSIGAVVSACLGMDMDSQAIERAMREMFTPDNTKAMFNLSFSGTSTGGDVMREMLDRLTGGRSFDDLAVPVTVMTVDLDAKEPEPISEGPVLDSLLAATALAGFVPPFRRGNQRLIDALALVPVPSDAARALGADIVVSVNIMSRNVLDAWPGQSAPEPTTKRERMLDVLLEVMDLGQLDSSARHAARADVPITPAFGPATWRDFELADLFLEAGRLAATAQLDRLKALAAPPR